jgi:hypothetical protein
VCLALCGRCKIGDVLDGPFVKPGEDIGEVVADRYAEPAATFDHREDRGHAWSGLLTADVDPIFSTGGDGAHGVLSKVVAKFQFRVLEEERGPIA